MHWCMCADTKAAMFTLADVPESVTCCSVCRLYQRRYVMLLHFILLMFLFGSAAYKAQGICFMAATLLFQLPLTFLVLCKVQVGSAVVCWSSGTVL